MEILLRDSTNSGKAGGGEEAVAMRQMEVANIDILFLLLFYLMEWLPSLLEQHFIFRWIWPESLICYQR